MPLGPAAALLVSMTPGRGTETPMNHFAARALDFVIPRCAIAHRGWSEGPDLRCAMHIGESLDSGFASSTRPGMTGRRSRERLPPRLARRHSPPAAAPYIAAPWPHAP